MAVIAAIAGFPPAMARDINLDEIYFKSSSPYQTKLLLGKLDAWFAVGARLVDRNVIFSGWMSGAELAYVKEEPGLGENLVCTYHVQSKRSAVAARVKGDVMYARVTPNGRHLVIKRLIRKGDIVPEGEIVIVALPGGAQTILSRPNPLLDHTISPDGNSLLLESREGIEEYRIPGGSKRLVLARPACAAGVTQSSPTLAFPSPDRTMWVLLNGGGGTYRACLSGNGASREIRGITSCAEFWWLGKTAFAYRGGSAGDYSVVVHRVRDNSERTIGGGSLNTSIGYSPHAGILSWLRDGCIMLYYPSSGRHVATGLEGEDVDFNPSGSSFTALIGHRLFLADMDSLRRKGIELKRAMVRVLSYYEELSRLPEERSNEFTPEYLGRKIRLYTELLQPKK